MAAPMRIAKNLFFLGFRNDRYKTGNCSLLSAAKSRFSVSLVPLRTMSMDEVNAEADKKVKKAMSAPPWREAASLILACKSPLMQVVGNDLGAAMVATTWNNKTQHQVEQQQQVSRVDYRILMVKRSQLSSFMANAYVYPGGLCEKSDFSPKWRDVFKAVGTTDAQLEAFNTRIAGPRPQMIERPLTLTSQNLDPAKHLPGEIAYRISAIRETFEETGVLLVCKGAPTSEDPQFEAYAAPEAKAWREKMRKDPEQFREMCLAMGVCPNLWALHEWWDWLTPISVGHRRYDAMFYFCCLDKQPDVILDQSEVVTLRWCTPLGILEEYSMGSVFLAPPQVYEMSKLVNLSSYQQLVKFCRQREVKGVDQWLPVIGAAEDGVVSLLPGDDLYPSDPDYFGRGPGPEFPFSLEELRKRCANLNRIEVQGPFCAAYCNIDLPRGILPPITFKGPEIANIQSML